MQFFCQTSGLNVISYYGKPTPIFQLTDTYLLVYHSGPRIYKSLNITTQTSLIIIGISGTLALVYNTIALTFIDKVGRVKPLIVGALGCAAAMLINAILSKYFPTDSDNADALRAQVAMTFVINFFVALGVISWVYPAEIFPTEVRARGNALSTFTNWSVNLIFAQCSPIALGDIGFGYFYVFFGLNLVAATVFFLFYPETKGVTLERMDEVFGDKIQVVPDALGESEKAKVAVDELEKGKF